MHFLEEVVLSGSQYFDFEFYFIHHHLRVKVVGLLLLLLPMIVQPLLDMLLIGVYTVLILLHNSTALSIFGYKIIFNVILSEAVRVYSVDSIKQGYLYSSISVCVYPTRCHIIIHYIVRNPVISNV